MNKAIQKGFTLIELLVVITIIGILATGAVTTFTSQIQKARDTTRITDIKALQSAIEQVYQDQTEYPQANEFVTDLTDYMERLPQDPKHAQPCNANSAAGGSTTTDCGYAYISTPDANGILYGEYEVSTAFENTGNVNSRAVTDSGNDALRLESGLNVGGAGANTTSISAGGITAASGACTPAGAAAGSSAGTALIIINGSPATAGNQCG